MTHFTNQTQQTSPSIIEQTQGLTNQIRTSTNQIITSIRAEITQRVENLNLRRQQIRLERDPGLLEILEIEINNESNAISQLLEQQHTQLEQISQAQRNAYQLIYDESRRISGYGQRNYNGDLERGHGYVEDYHFRLRPHLAE